MQREAVVFQNATQRTLEVVWLSYQGNPHRYNTLMPGASILLYTFTSHPWVFRDPFDPQAPCTVEGQLVFYAPAPQPSQPRPRAVICDAQRLPWSPSHHLFTPPAFRAAARELLLCHRRLSVVGPVPRRRPAGHRRPQGSKWRQRLCSAVCWPVPLPQEAEREEVEKVEEARQAVPRRFHLGDLPQELLLAVLATAAPSVPLLLKPLLPYGMQPGDVPEEAQQRLFRQTVGVDASVRATRQAVPTEQGQQQGLPAQQLWQLQQQQQHPMPPPMPVAAVHPFMHQHMV